MEVIAILTVFAAGIAVGRTWRVRGVERINRDLLSALSYERGLSKQRHNRIQQLERGRIDRAFAERTIASRFIDVREDWS